MNYSENNFWAWFIQHQAEFYEKLEDPNFQETFFEELSDRLHQIDQNLTFEFSPILENGKRQMCISADGIKDGFPAVEKLIAQSPKLENWEFKAFRQRIPNADQFVLKIGDDELSCDDVYFQYTYEDQLGIQLNIRDYEEDNPQFQNAVYILLDALIGEYDVTMNIGWIEWTKLNEEDIDELYNIRLLPDIVLAFASPLNQQYTGQYQNDEDHYDEDHYDDDEYEEQTPRTLEELRAWAEELNDKPLEEQYWDDWQELADATFGQDTTLYRRAIQAQIDLWHRDTQWALTSDDPDVATPPTNLLLALQKHLAFSWADEDSQKSKTLLKQVIADSQNLQTQHPDENWLLYWVNLSRDFAYALPDEVETIIAQLKKAMPQPATAFDHRAIQILSERTRSYASYQQGNLQKAIEQGMAGFFCLHGSPYDMDAPNDGRLDLIQWLEEAGDTERQVEVMDTLMYDIYDTPEEVRYQVLMNAWEMIQNGVQHPKLAICIGEAGYQSSLYMKYGDEYEGAEFGNFNELPTAAIELISADPQQRDGVTWYRDYVELAKQWAKGNPMHEGMVDIDEAIFLHQTTDEELQDDAYNRRVLDLLERGCKKAPKFVTQPSITALWMYRLRVYGRKAVTMPFVPAGTAAWSYNSGWCFLSDYDEMELTAYFEDLDISGEEAATLAMQYYADGIARYEHFWATGEGGWRDGWAQIYAMMCKNYAILLRKKDHNYEASLEAELKAINISPFGEAYEGAASCYKELEDWENYIKMHEELWQIIEEYGYSEYHFGYYLQEITRALNNLGRNDELYTWYERLQHWWANLDEAEQDEVIDDYYAALTVVLGRWSDVAPKEALAELENYTDELFQYMGTSDTTNGNIFAYVGLAYKNNEQYREAIRWYERAIVTEDDEHNKAIWLEWWEEASQAFRNENAENSDDDPNDKPENKKPWWKRW